MSGSCPICQKSRVEAFRPFCSKRCADVDLNRWLTGAYAVPALEVDDPDDTPNLGAGSAGDGREYQFDD